MADDACRLCGRAGLEVALGDASDHFTGDRFRILRCPACGAGFTDPVPEELDRYYPARYRGYGGLVAAAQRAAYRLRVRSWTRGFAAPGRALEIGCGPGVMLEALRRRGWRVQGIERNPEAARHARETLGLEVTDQGVETLPVEPGFDLIVLFQVLEHLKEPVAVLRECAKRLRPGGRLVVAVPDFGGWQAGFGGARWLHLDPPRHLVHFTRVSLRSALESCGLEIAEESSPCLDLDTFGWVQTAANRVLGDYNSLTRRLMGIEPFGPKVFLSAVVGAAALPFAALLALAGSAARRGAFLEAIARRSS